MSYYRSDRIGAKNCSYRVTSYAETISIGLHSFDIDMTPDQAMRLIVELHKAIHSVMTSLSHTILADEKGQAEDVDL